MAREHAAINAWRRLRSGRVAPERVEALKTENQTTAIYRLSWATRADPPLIAKRCRQSTARIERTVYEEILPNLPLPALQYYGFVAEPNGDFCWLFMEDVSADKRYNPDLEAHRVAAALWMGIMNTSSPTCIAAARLPQRGPGHYLNLVHSAHDTILSNLGNPSLTDADRALLATLIDQCDHLAEDWSQLAQTCEGMPPTLVHGDFIGKNVAVRASGDGMILLPFDWEKAGWGTVAEDISRVDLATYRSAVRDHWPGLSARALGRLANAGRVFRCLVFLDWIAPRLARDAVAQPIDDARRCEGWLADLMQAAAWRE